MYWTDFHNHFTIWKRFTCRWWICTSFSNLSMVLPWQPNNFAVMKVNWYYAHSLQFGRGSTVLFPYYLLGGDTVAPSGLLARLCHAFLVIVTLKHLARRKSSSTTNDRALCVSCTERYLQVASKKSWRRCFWSPTIQTSTSVRCCPSKRAYLKTEYR